jgi:hypothetical protein
MKLKLKLFAVTFATMIFVLPVTAGLSHINGPNNTASASTAQHSHPQSQVAANRFDRQLNPRSRSRYKRGVRPRAKPRLVVVAPRNRRHRNVIIVRPHGHSYWGYGRFYADADAWKWLALTAITVKLLDNIDEQTQRQHEAAQVAATTAPVGETITWETSDARGSVTTIREDNADSGATCREFQQTVTIAGESETAVGTACLRADGSWKMQS